MSSMDYIRGLQLQVVVATPLLTKPVKVVDEGIENDENICNEAPDVLYSDGSVLYGADPSGGPNQHGDGPGVSGYGAGGCGLSCEQEENVKETSVGYLECNTDLDAGGVQENYNRDHIQNEVDGIKSSVVSIEERVGEVDVKELYRELDGVKKRIQEIENVLQIHKTEESTFSGKKDNTEDIGCRNMV